LEILNNIFPEYSFERDEYKSSDFTYHALLQNFIAFYGADNFKFTERQFRDFAALINKSVEASGNLENAFGTCFLEHLGEIRAPKPLSSFLSDAAKERLHA
jgi:hypothetical protein